MFGLTGSNTYAIIGTNQYAEHVLGRSIEFVLIALCCYNVECRPRDRPFIRPYFLKQHKT